MNKTREIFNISKPATVLCVDASTNSLAFSLFENGRLIKYGKIRFNGSDSIYKAGDAGKMCLSFFKNISADALVLESVIYSTSPKTTVNLALVQGAILSVAQITGIPIVKTVSPMSWQSHISNRLLTAEEKNSIEKNNPGKSASWYKTKQRETRKNKTIEMVNKKYKIKVSDDDVADAIGIGWYVSDRWNAIFNGQE